MLIKLETLSGKLLQMVNYNFLNLTPIEFEELSRDILQIRDGINFESFGVGKDGGIDFRYKSKGVNIIVQAKRYKEYKDLQKILFKEEIIKVKRLKPTRYILISSVNFNPFQKQEILDVFKDYIINENDILGGRDLNNLLSQPKYTNVRKTHYKLWLTGTDALQDIIEQITYRKEFNLAKTELDIVKRDCKYYVQNKSFPEALDNIEENRMVLISGTPGSGKTTLARALISYYISKESFTELVYISEGIRQAWTMLKDEYKQIFFFDDFLGSISFDKLPRNEDKLLSKFIEKINSSDNKILILTTREYVLRQAQLKHPEFKNDLYKLSKCIVEPGSYTEYIKAKILYNHIYFSDLHPRQILILLDKNNYERIIYHSHYNPRLIDSYIKFASKYETINEYQFLRDFIKYLDHPREFWGDIYDKLSSEAQLLLLTLFSLNEPVYLDDLKLAYNKASEVYLKKFNNLIISPDTFNNILKELSDTFIRIDLESHFLNFYSHIIRFQNPSIKDFLLEYLRNNEDLVEIMIEGSCFLNQLIFAFGTHEDKINDYDANDDEPFYGNKIVLKGRLKALYLNKFISDFDDLKLSTINKSEFTDQKTLYHSTDDLLTFKLLELNSLFGMGNMQVQAFVINRFQEIISTYEEKITRGGGKILSKDAMLYFPNLVKIVQPFVIIDPDKLLNYCYNSITFTSEFLDFYDFKEIYAAAFEKILNEKKKTIENEIKKTIIDDIDYFEGEAMDEEIDRLIDMEYPEVFEKFGLEITEKFTKKLHKLINRESWSKEEQKEWKAQSRKNHEERIRTESDIANLFNSLKATYTIDIFQTDKDLNAFLKECVSIYGVAIINKIKNNRYSFIRPFLYNKLSISIILEYYKRYLSLPQKESVFWQRIYDIMYDQLSSKDLFIKQELETMLSNLAFMLLLSNQSEFTQKSLKKNDVYNSSYTENFDELSPIILKTGKWYQFINEEFQVYLGALYIKNFSEIDSKDFYNNQSISSNNNIIHYAPGLLDLLFNIDNASFIKYYLIPVLEDFSRMLDFSTNQSLVLSYCKTTDIHFDFKISETGFLDEYSAGNSCGHEEDLINLLNIPISFHTLDGYFLKQYITDEDFKSKEDLYKTLFKYVIDNCPRENDNVITINMYSELLNLQFYNLLKSLGIEQHVVNDVQQLKDKIFKIKRSY